MLKEKEFTDLWKPKMPLATNSWEKGQYRTNRDKALGMRFIETSPKTYKNLIVLDLDEEQALWKVKELVDEEGKLPEPSYVTVNPASEHAQIGYFIDGFVNTPKAISYFDSVFNGMKWNSGTDLAYGGRSMRNPLSPYQQTHWGTDKQYKLSELATYSPDKAPTGVFEQGEGRNANTFETLRKYAYKAFRLYPKSSDFNRVVWAYALEINFSWEEPLTIAELQRIHNSVMRWVTKNFSMKKFSQRQSAVAKKRWGDQADKRAEEILAYLDAGFKVKEIGEALGLSYEAAKKAVQRAKKR